MALAIQGEDNIVMPISNYMKSEAVLFLNADSRDNALKQMVGMLSDRGQITDPDLFLKAIVEREKIVSTGIGMGIAIPHAKIPQYDHFFISIGILQKAVDWNALDGSPVRVIFLIGGPDDKQTEYLQVLSSLTQAIKSEERRKKMIITTDPKAMIELFHGI